MIEEEKFFSDKDQLKDKIKRIRDTLNYKFKEMDNMGVSCEYVLKLDEVLNPNINIPFERIVREKNGNNSYIYFGQTNAKGSMHGLGNQLFRNGFKYKGMFVNGQREGLGITYDLNGNKYKGEHKNGMREGKGIFKTKDRIYEGGWSMNKMHGKGREYLPNGEVYIVYFKHGQRLEAIANGKFSPHQLYPNQFNTSIDTNQFILGGIDNNTESSNQSQFKLKKSNLLASQKKNYFKDYSIHHNNNEVGGQDQHQFNVSYLDASIKRARSNSPTDSRHSSIKNPQTETLFTCTTNTSVFLSARNKEDKKLSPDIQSKKRGQSTKNLNKQQSKISNKKNGNSNSSTTNTKCAIF